MESVFEKVKEIVNEIKQLSGEDKVEVTMKSALVNDLGFVSLDVAQLIAMLEAEFSKDPFAEGASLAKVVTVEDLCKLYI